MKKLFFIFLLLPTFVNGQTIDGYWGLKLGQDIDSVKKYIASTGIGTLVSEDTSKLVYDHCVFGDDSAATVDLHFYTGKLYLGSILTKGDTSGYKYDELTKQLTEKYGEPVSTSERHMQWQPTGPVLSSIVIINISSEEKISLSFVEVFLFDKKNESYGDKLRLEYEKGR